MAEILKSVKVKWLKYCLGNLPDATRLPVFFPLPGGEGRACCKHFLSIKSYQYIYPNFQSS